jgi:hypothetical protein
VEREPFDDLVDFAARRAQRKADQPQLIARHGGHGRAVVDVVPGGEHLLGVDRERNAARQRTVVGGAQRGAIAGEDEYRLNVRPPASQ